MSSRAAALLSKRVQQEVSSDAVPLSSVEENTSLSFTIFTQFLTNFLVFFVEQMSHLKSKNEKINVQIHALISDALADLASKRLVRRKKMKFQVFLRNSPTFASWKKFSLVEREVKLLLAEGCRTEERKSAQHCESEEIDLLLSHATLSPLNIVVFMSLRAIFFFTAHSFTLS